MEGRNSSYEELSADNQNLTFKVLEKRLMDITGIDACDKNVLKTLNLYSEKEGYNIAAEILADDNSYPGIDIGKFGESISIIQKRKTFEHISILTVYDKAYEMYKDYYQYEVIEGAVRKKVERIPAEAFREAIANALIHRVWDIKEQIRVFMFDDRIEVFSPGGLPFELSKEEYLAGNYSKLRNPIISNVFYRLKLVEIFGTGIRRIKECYEDSVSKPIFEIYENSIKVVLPVVKSKKSMKAEEVIVYDILSKTEGKSMSEIVRLSRFGKSKIHTILNALISQEFVYITGNGRGTKYHKR